MKFHTSLLFFLLAVAWFVTKSTAAPVEPDSSTDEKKLPELDVFKPLKKSAKSKPAKIPKEIAVKKEKPIKKPKPAPSFLIPVPIFAMRDHQNVDTAFILSGGGLFGDPESRIRP